MKDEAGEDEENAAWIYNNVSIFFIPKSIYLKIKNKNKHFNLSISGFHFTLKISVAEPVLFSDPVDPKIPDPTGPGSTTLIKTNV